MSSKVSVAKLTLVGVVFSALLSAYSAFLVKTIESDLEVERQDIERAELFQRLLADLDDAEKAKFAILVLWRLYREDEDKRVVFLAALSAGNEALADLLFSLEPEEVRRNLYIPTMKEYIDGEETSESPVKRLLTQMQSESSFYSDLEKIKTLTAGRELERESAAKRLGKSTELEKLKKVVIKEAEENIGTPSGVWLEYAVYHMGFP